MRSLTIPLPSALAAATAGVVLLAIGSWWWWRVRRQRAVIRAVAEQRSDRAVLRMLRDVDGEEQQETDVSFYLYFATQKAAESAAARVATLPIDAPTLGVGVEPAARGTQWLCQVTTRIVPTERAIRRTCAELRALARTCGGEFDGWEAAMPW